MHIEDFLGKLNGVREEGNRRWKALCPVHEADGQGHEPSLSVGLDGNKILVHCFGGCRTEDILSALGLEKSDLFADGDGVRSAKRIETSYPYRDENGNLLYEVLRYTPRDFSQRRPGREGEWINDLKGVRRVLYRLPELLAADPAMPVFVVEGEKDVETLRDLGFVATTNSGGAGKWRPEFSEYLRGRVVAIIPDKDERGRKHADQVAKSLYQVAGRLKVVALTGPGKDVTEWLAFGGTPERLTQLVAEAPEFTPADPDVEDLGLISLDQVEPEEVTWLWYPYLPLGKLSLMAGDPAVGKTFVALDIAARVTRGAAWPDGSPGGAPSRVIYVSYEDGLADTLVPRAKAAGADLSSMISCSESPPRREDVDKLRDMVAAHRPHLVVLDPIQAFVSGRLDMNKANQVRDALSPLGELARDFGCSVLVIAHLTKGQRGSALYRVLGSIDFVAAARSALAVGFEEEGCLDRRVVLPVKSNLAPKGAGLVFDIVEKRVHWLGTADVTADEVLGEREHTGALGEAELFLRRMLADGPRLEAEVQGAARQAGMSTTTLRRAKRNLEVESKKLAHGPWVWSLHEGSRHAVDHLEHLRESSDGNVTPSWSSSMSTLAPLATFEDGQPAQDDQPPEYPRDPVPQRTCPKMIKMAKPQDAASPDPDDPSTWPTCRGCERPVPSVNDGGVCPDCEATLGP